jgi:integrase/recombinase XerD
MATVAIVLRKDKVNKKGDAPIYFRIIKNRKVSYVNSHIKVPVEYWNPNTLSIKPSTSTINPLKAF